VAEIRHGEAREVVIVSAVRNLVEKAGAGKPSLHVTAELVWEQDERILDFGFGAEWQRGRGFDPVVLQPDKIAFYDHRAEAWHLNREIAIPHARPVQRNVGGRMDLQAGLQQHWWMACASGSFSVQKRLRVKACPQFRMPILP